MVTFESIQVDSGVKRVEEDKKENKVVLYFDDIPKKERSALENAQYSPFRSSKETSVVSFIVPAFRFVLRNK
jgi:hypothetical protein